MRAISCYLCRVLVAVALADVGHSLVPERECNSLTHACPAPDEIDNLSLLQQEFQLHRRSRPRPDQVQEVAPVERVTINHLGQGTFVLGTKEVVLLGGNYVLKAQPYFPDVAVIRMDAHAMAVGAKNMKYEHPSKRILPCVRLGALFEGAMPEKGKGINSAWAKKLDDAVKAFASEGIYVFLDIHQDALSTTNGGEGMPWWMGAEMQKTAYNGESYIVTPDHPLSLILPSWLTAVLRTALPDVPIPRIRTVPGDDDPWRAFAVGQDAGNPAHMNVGNLNMRLNNHDQAWQDGTLTFSKQMQNFAHRFFQSPWTKHDREAFFDPFVAFATHLCRVWENNTNVVAVELFNEPPMGGLPDYDKVVKARRNIFSFYGAVLEALDDVSPPIKTPIALEDIGGGVPGGGTLIDLLGMMPLDGDSMKRISSWARKGQLALSFHYYKGPVTEVDFPELAHLAKKHAAALGAGAGVPVFLSEFFNSTKQGIADTLAQAVELGCNAATYWQYVNTAYTGTDGWFKYSDVITNEGDPIHYNGTIDEKAWGLYSQTVSNGTFWGAAITGGRGGKMGVLELVPDLFPEYDKVSVLQCAAAAAVGAVAMAVFLCLFMRR